MFYYFTEILQEYKQERSFAKWLAKVAEQAKETAYNKRGVIDKRSIENDSECIMSLRYAYKPLKELIKKGKVIDLFIKVDDKGYPKFTLIFPITQEEWNTSVENRRNEIKELGQYGSLCVDIDSCVWNVCKERVHNMLPFLYMNDSPSYPYYPKYGGDVLKRQVDVYRAKKNY